MNDLKKTPKNAGLVFVFPEKNTMRGCMKKNANVINHDNENSSYNVLKFRKQLEAASEKSFGIIEDFFDTGYIDFLAKLLVYLPVQRRVEALAKLPEEIRQKVKDILDTDNEKTNIAPEVLSAAGTVLKRSGFYAKACAAEVMNNSIFPCKQTKKELADFYTINPILAMNVDYYATDLSILLFLDDRSIQKWLREVDQMDLAIALKDLDNEIREKVFQNMSHSAAALLREDMEFVGPVINQSDIIETQKELIGILEKLEEKGEIYISRDSFSDIGSRFIN